jgi:hypothetical protein
MHVSGRVARVKWTYFTAAEVSAYTVTYEAAGAWQMGAKVEIADAYLLTQRPLMFVAPFRGGAWQWPVKTVELAADGRRLTARLGDWFVTRKDTA